MSAQFLDKHFGRLGNRMFQSAYIYAQFRKGVIPDIYLQSPKWFAGYEDEIRKLFGEGIGKDDRVAIHYRKNDYINNSFYVQLDKTTYYQEAIKYFPNKQFLVFSDNIELAKDFFNKENFGIDFDFSTGLTEEQDLKLFASCSGQIIANSSYSYWGAYLCPHKGHIVIAPSKKRWYTDYIERTICPKEWIRL